MSIYSVGIVVFIALLLLFLLKKVKEILLSKFPLNISNSNCFAEIQSRSPTAQGCRWQADGGIFPPLLQCWRRRGESPLVCHQGHAVQVIKSNHHLQSD